MTPTAVRQLAVMTVFDPAAAARRLLDLQLDRDVLWQLLALVVVLDTLLFGISNQGLAMPNPYSAIFESPAGYGVLVGIILVVSVFAIFRVGRMMGGRGSFFEVMTVMIWLQYMSLAAQIILLALALTVPVLFSLFSLAATLIGFLILLHFVKTAHKLDGLLHAAGVVLASVFAVSASLLILLSLAGGQLTGASVHV
ncbi:MAG: YIP1 family protein [Pseudomonadota bacterium]